MNMLNMIFCVCILVEKVKTAELFTPVIRVIQSSAHSSSLPLNDLILQFLLFQVVFQSSAKHNLPTYITSSL